MAVRSHTLDIYGTELHLAWTDKQWRNDRDALSGEFREATDEALGLTVSSFDLDNLVFHLCFYIDLDSLKSDAVHLVQIIAHKAAHGAGRILDHIGEEYDGGSEARWATWLGG